MCVLFKRIQCINDTLVSAGRSDLLRSDSDSNPKSVEISFSRTSSDMYAHEWNATDYASSKIN